MFGKLWDWFRVHVLRQEGQIQEKIDALYEDPYVVDRAFEKAIHGDEKAFKTFRDAVANQMALHQQLVGTHKELSSELEEMELDVEGALAEAKSIAAELQKKGLTPEQIQVDQRFLDAQSFHHDTSTTIDERRARLEQLEARIGDLDEKIKTSKLQMTELKRALDKKKQERVETKQDMIIDKQLQETSDMLSGIDVDGHNADLQRARQARARLHGRAQLAQEVSGMDGKAQRARYRERLQKTKANTEFANLVGLTTATVAKEDAAKAPADKPAADTGVLT